MSLSVELYVSRILDLERRILEIDVGIEYDLVVEIRSRFHACGELLQLGSRRCVERHGRSSRFRGYGFYRTVNFDVAAFDGQFVDRRLFADDERIGCRGSRYICVACSGKRNRRCCGFDFDSSTARCRQIERNRLLRAFHAGILNFQFRRQCGQGSRYGGCGRRKYERGFFRRRVGHDYVGLTLRKCFVGCRNILYLIDILRNVPFEFRVDRYADRALPGQQVARHVGAIVAADRNVGEGVVGADLRTAVVECHREIGERGPGFRGPEEIHRDRTVGLGEFCRLIADVGRSAHFARQGVERRGKALESDLVSRGFQRLVSDFVQVVGLYHQQTERTFQGYGPGERARHFERLVGEERIPLVAVADERSDFRDRLQIRRIVGLVREVAFAAFGAVGPEYEVVGLLGDQPQVVEGNRLAGDALLDTVVEFVVAVDLQNTAVGRGAGAEIVGNRTGSVLRNGDRKRGGGCRVRNDTFVLLTCGEGQCKARRQQEEFFHGLLSFCELPPPSDFSEGEDVTQRFVIYFEELRFGI